MVGGRWQCVSRVAGGRWQVKARYIFCQALFMQILKVPGKVRSGCNEIKLVVFDLVRTV